jgi:hypothetical protein
MATSSCGRTLPEAMEMASVACLGEELGPDREVDGAARPPAGGVHPPLKAQMNKESYPQMTPMNADAQKQEG